MDPTLASNICFPGFMCISNASVYKVDRHAELLFLIQELNCVSSALI